MQYITAIFIGFALRRRTISEADRPFPYVQTFDITVDVRSMVVSERDYGVYFEAPGSNVGRTARVGAHTTNDVLSHDALFGFLNATTGKLEDARLLFRGSTVLLSPLTITIINDFNIESQECFTISIVRQRVYECFDDDDNSDSFFCLHEICIEDDDGLFSDIHLNVLLKMFFSASRTICC